MIYSLQAFFYFYLLLFEPEFILAMKVVFYFMWRVYFI